MPDCKPREIPGIDIAIVSKKLLVLHHGAGKQPFGENYPIKNRKCIRIFCCTSGSAKHMLDGKTIWVHKGDLVFIPTDVEYRFLEPRNSNYEEINLILFPSYSCAMMTLHPDMVRSMEKRQKEKSYVFHPTGRGHDNFIQAFETLYEEYTTCRPGWEMVTYATAACILASMFRPVFEENSPLSLIGNEALTEQILTYIDEHYCEMLTVETIARRFMIGSSKLSKLFSQYVGTSCYQYIIKRRLAAAQVYLLEGIPAKQVWTLCGFPDYASFYRHYKKSYGVSPSRFMAAVYSPRESRPNKSSIE